MTTHADGRHIGLGALVVGAGLDYAESLVAGTLEFRGKASRGAQSAFDRALDDCVRINGFRDASKAPGARLKGPILDALADGDAAFARALLGVWAESRPELLDAVKAYLGVDGTAADSDDPDGRPWNAGELDEAVDDLLGRHEDLYEPDIGLMLCFVSGRCVHTDEPVAGISSPLMLEFLAELEDLDHDAPDWEDVGPFLEAVDELGYLRFKKAADTAIEGILALADKLQGDYGAELAYLGLQADIAEWTKEAARRVWPIKDSLAIVDGLLEKLHEYQPIRPQAETRTEEAERAVERVAAEEAILALSDSWRQLMSQPDPSPEVKQEDDRGAGSGEGVDAVAWAEELEELRAEVEQLRNANRGLEAEAAKVARERDGVAAERDSLQEEVARLEDEIASGRETVKIWRLAGVSARMEEAGLPASGQAEPRTVRDAVSLAENLFPDRLAVALNSKSDKRSQFQKPQEVFDALAWLATDYHHRRANPGGSPDFDKLLKEACPGWSYKSNQTEITREQFEQWYTTTWEDRSYDLSPHLGKGISHDPQNTIRIAFAWDEDRRRVVVGYIGMHQRNRKS